MRYAYYDLGHQQEGSAVVVRLRGSAANVILLSPLNFAYYRAGGAFFYNAGGHFQYSPVKLEIPRDGHWYVVVDLGGYAGRVHGAVEVVPPSGEQPDPDSEETLIEEQRNTKAETHGRATRARSRSERVRAPGRERSASRNHRKRRTKRRSDDRGSGAPLQASG